MSVSVSGSVVSGFGGGEELLDADLDDGGELAEVGVAGRSAGASGLAPAAGGVAGGQRPVHSRRATWSRKDPGSTIEWLAGAPSTVSWRTIRTAKIACYSQLAL